MKLFYSSSQCSASKCVLNCELQGKQDNEKFRIWFCKTIDICQYGNLSKHKTCI